MKEEIYQKTYKEWIQQKAAENRVVEDRESDEQKIRQLVDKYIRETQMMVDQGTGLQKQAYLQ